jgi:exonuclease VII small subunit
MEQYYAIRELEPLVQTLVDAHGDLESALYRWERAIKAVSDGWQAIEAKRAAAYEAAE